MSAAYLELEHPADLLLEIHGRSLEDLFENALFAFYSQVADPTEIPPLEPATFAVLERSPDEALRAVLAEALYRFDTEGYVAGAASVKAVTDADLPELVRVTASLCGTRPPRRPGDLLTEIKAVTYHQLTVKEVAPDTWRATVLFDV